MFAIGYRIFTPWSTIWPRQVRTSAWGVGVLPKTPNGLTKKFVVPSAAETSASPVAEIADPISPKAFEIIPKGSNATELSTGVRLEAGSRIPPVVGAVESVTTATGTPVLGFTTVAASGGRVVVVVGSGVVVVVVGSGVVVVVVGSGVVVVVVGSGVVVVVVGAAVVVVVVVVVSELPHPKKPKTLSTSEGPAVVATVGAAVVVVVGAAVVVVVVVVVSVLEPVIQLNQSAFAEAYKNQ